ncbi:MAG: ATP-binding cassette domain-containing protein [Desulfobacterales bacterium]|nr:ATP-binding cassette domain-containing protein [Desulfobacterales bacterium]
MKDPNKVIIQLEHISKTFRTSASLFKGGQKEIIALNDVSFKIFKGEIFGLVGESGSGKTTTGRLIVKLEEPDDGKLLFDGNDITKIKGKALKNFRRKVQMIFQDPYQSLNPYLSVYDSISEPLVVHNVGNSETRKDMVRESLNSVGLTPPDDFFYRYPHQMSGGQRQRIAIARAMILNPAFVVADEPTSMLDASIAIHIFNILSEIQKKLNVTFLFITHSLAAARYLCDRIAVIYKGELVEIGSAENIIQNPSHPYTRALIQAHPRFRH